MDDNSNLSEESPSTPLRLRPVIESQLARALVENHLFKSEDEMARFVVEVVSEYVRTYGTPRLELYIGTADFADETQTRTGFTTFTAEMASPGKILIDPRAIQGSKTLGDTILHSLGHALLPASPRPIESIEEFFLAGGKVVHFLGFAIAIDTNTYGEDGILILKTERSIEEGVLDYLAKVVDPAYESTDQGYLVGSRVTEWIIDNSFIDDEPATPQDLASLVQDQNVLGFVNLVLQRSIDFEVTLAELKSVLKIYQEAFDTTTDLVREANARKGKPLTASQIKKIVDKKFDRCINLLRKLRSA